MGKAEDLVKQEVISVLVQCQKYLRFWVVATGKAKYKNKDGSDRWVSYGKDGSADIQGLALPNGRFFGVELKAPKGILSEDQEKWGNMVQDFGGFYVVAWGDMAKITVLKQLDFYNIIPHEFYMELLK
jgi:hypothetical protein